MRFTPTGRGVPRRGARVAGSQPDRRVRRRCAARAGPGREHEALDERLAWNRHLAAAGWTCLGWPAEHGGRGATLAQQVIFHEEYARAGAPGPGRPRRRGAARPDADRVRHAGAAAALPAADRGGRGAVVPGLLRAGRRLRPRQRGHHGRACDGDEWVITGQKVWTSLAHVADWCFVLARTEPGSRRGTRACPTCWCRWTSRGSRSARSGSSPAPSEFNEVFFDGARTAAANVVGEPGDGWRVAMATLGFERGVATLGQQVGFRARARATWSSAARRTGAADDPLIRDRLARAWIGLRVIRAHALRTLARGRRPGRRASVLEAALGALAPGPRRAGHGRARRRSWWPAARLRPRPTGSGCSCSAGPTRSTAAPTRSSATSSPSARSACPGRPARDRRRQPVTRRATACWPARSSWSPPRPAPASARAAARRCLEEGARVVISDQHERRLAETRDELAAGARRPGAGRSPATSPTRRRSPRWSTARRRQFGRIDVMVNNAGLGGTASVAGHDRRAVVAGPRRHADRHVPLHPGRAAPDGRPGPRRRDRQQRLGARLAGPGRARRTTPRPRPA